ncbi:MAG TPA: alanine/glycine:cation symporter family protein [Cyclobacteriaceae bacterium]|nr:alanine/glycine:cation symporter family protein [Cyclobacteriaceae bacterium]
MQEIRESLAQAAAFVWWPVLFLIIGGGLFFLAHSGFVQYKYFRHAILLIRGKYDEKNAPGQISAYKALSTALASTVGMGNLAGVAAAIALGGPGAIFWMWITALIGMSTNFYTSTLASLFRGKDSVGEIQGGPMYVIREALGKRWQPFANFFCVCCMVGCLPIFQANQLTQALIDIGLKPMGFSEALIEGTSISTLKLSIGVLITIMASVVIIGGIQRIGNWAGRMVPAMIVLHFLSVSVILINYADRIPYYIKLIFNEAFSPNHFHGDPFLGGLLGGIIMLGVRRATFSNEAGLGTSPMAMGASKSNEPVREGLVSMLSPAIDTLLSCTFTALAILVTDVWQEDGASGITLTALAYEKGFPFGGDLILLVCVFVFALSSLFSYSYYGRKALAFMVGVKESRWYDYLYIVTIILGAIVSMDVVLNLIDIAFALMAIPTMISGFILAPKVKDAAKRYFNSIKR